MKKIQQQRCHVMLPVAIAAMCLSLAGCREQSPAETTTSSSSSSSTTADQAPAGPTNRIDIPASVRQNLGITFVNVAPRRVEQTLRVPGQFEYVPTARREYRTMLPGRIELKVEQYQRVEIGTVLYEIESPSWRDLQRQLTDAEASIARLTTRLESFGPLRDAHRSHEERLEETIAMRRERVTQLERVAEAGGGRVADLVEARTAVTTAEAALAETLEKDAELAAGEATARSDLEAAMTKRTFLIDSAAALVGLEPEILKAPVDTGAELVPRWRTINRITVSATAPGVIESLHLTNGAWADQESTVLTTVDPDLLRFRGVALQSDLARLHDGLPARIVPPTPTRASGEIDLADEMRGTLTLGLTGDPGDRTVDLIVKPSSLASWARAGVSGHLEVITDDTGAPALAVPLAAVQRDGLVPVLFRRDPKDPNKAIRIEADLGIDDGRWIVVNSGLRVGDEVVLDGAFQLMLATATGGTQTEGGHFHADGTFHSSDDH